MPCCWKTVDDLRSFIDENLSGNGKPDILTVPLGYIEPGHGLKAKMFGSIVIVTFQQCTNSMERKSLFSCGVTHTTHQRKEILCLLSLATSSLK